MQKWTSSNLHFQPQFLKLECDQLGLPMRLGGMSLTNPVRLFTFIPCISVSDHPTNSSDHHTRDQSSCWPCHNIATEPPLQPLSGEILNHSSANKEDSAQLDIRARSFLNGGKDWRVFHPNASSYYSRSLQAAFRNYEQVKKSEYGEHVRKVEHANSGRPTGGPLYEEKIKKPYQVQEKNEYLCCQWREENGPILWPEVQAESP